MRVVLIDSGGRHASGALKAVQAGEDIKIDVQADSSPISAVEVLIQTDDGLDVAQARLGREIHLCDGDTLVLKAPFIIQPSQQSVLDEKQDLDIRITKLDEFIERNPVFTQVPGDEQARLKRQLDVMHELSVILGDRIANFQASRPAPAGCRILEKPVNLSFTTTPKVIAAIFAVLLAVLLFCTYKVNTNPTDIAKAGVIFFGAVLCVLVLVAMHIEPYRQRSQREDLEQSLVHALAPGLHNRMDGAGVGVFIRAAADAILGGGVHGTKPTCSCSFKEGCSNCCPWLNADQIAEKNLAAKLCQHTAATYSALQQASRAAADKASFGAQADQRAEAEIVAAGLTAPRVTAEQIQALMSSLTWRYEQPEGSRHTFAHAFLGDFYLVSGYSAPVSHANFDAGKGMKYAREQAEGKARDKLWELEGYALFKQLA